MRIKLVTIIKIIILWTWLVNIGDFITTHIGLSYPNIYETNTLMSILMTTNYPLYLVMKLVIPTLFIIGMGIFCLKTKNRLNKISVLVAMIPMAILLSYAVINNIMVIYFNIQSIPVIVEGPDKF